MDSLQSEELLDDVRRTLLQARDLLGTSRVSISRDPSLLGIYDELRERLSEVDDERVREALAEIVATVERLGGLADEIEKLRDVRRAIKKSD